MGSMVYLICHCLVLSSVVKMMCVLGAKRGRISAPMFHVFSSTKSPTFLMVCNDHGLLVILTGLTLLVGYLMLSQEWRYWCEVLYCRVAAEKLISLRCKYGTG